MSDILQHSTMLSKTQEPEKEREVEIKKMRRFWLHLALFFIFLASGCVLLPDIPCQTDQDCQNGGLGKYVCFRGLQCVPPWWRNQIEEKLSHKTDTGPMQENIPESQFESKNDKEQTKETGREPQTEQAKNTDEPRCPNACELGKSRKCYDLGTGCTQNGANWDCQGICKTGTQNCAIFKQDGCPEWGKCQNATGPDPKESCDQLDNNCDGTTDEGCECKKGDIQPCYTKGKGCKKVGSSYSCTAPCQTGTQNCDNGKWEVCANEQGPNAEKCDSKDNDCDGIIDEGCVITVAGTGTPGFIEGPALQAQLYAPDGLALDSKGHLYIADSGNHRIRKLEQGNILTVAGNGQKGSFGGPALSSTFDTPSGIAFDSKGNLYIADFGNNMIRRLSSVNTVEVYAGSGKLGTKNGSAVEAEFWYPTIVAIGPTGNLLVTGSASHLIRSISTGQMVTTFAGNTQGGQMDGIISVATFKDPHGMTVDGKGNIFIVDRENRKIRQIDTNKNVTTIAGSGTKGNKDGPALSAEFNDPFGITVDAAGNLYITDLGSSTIRKLDKNGVISTIAGTGVSGFKDGEAKQALFNSPQGITTDNKGNLYIADTGNHRIRKIILP